jgi:hypothetical protein
VFRSAEQSPAQVVARWVKINLALRAWFCPSNASTSKVAVAVD